MEIILYHNYYEFHFRAEVDMEQVAAFLNILPLGFKLQPGSGGVFVDSQRGPGVFTLHHKSTPREETPVPSEQANYYLRWNARASEGDLPRLALQLSRQLSQEMETLVWLVDAYGRILRQEGRASQDYYQDDEPGQRSA